MRTFVLCFALTLMTAAAMAQSAFRPFEFALLGDPQIGFGQGGEYADVGRLAKIVDSVNQVPLPLVIVAGDLVQDRSLWQEWLFAWQARRIKAKVVLAPGNHDVINPSSLAAFRDRHGADHFDTVYNDVAFIVINSETARDRRISSAEHDEQWAFIARSLETHHAAKRTHIVLVTHRPPFVADESELASDANWPLDTRARLLTLARRYGVRWILAGHLHRTHTVQTADGLQVVVVAGSARSYDLSPVDYRLFRVERDGLSHTRVAVAPPTVEPFSVPGLRGWTPRLFDFSVRHWLFTAFYALAGIAALRTTRAKAGMPAGRIWRAVAMLMFAFAANMQLDIDELLQEVGRVAAQLSGIYPLRHLASAAALLALAVVATVLLARHSRNSRGEQPLTIALAALSIPAAWFLLSAISHHDIGMLFNEGWWDLLIVAALATIALCARRARRRRGQAKM